MRDHRRRTEIRLIVLGEEAQRVAAALRRWMASPHKHDSAPLEVAYHVSRYLYFSDLPVEFRECNPRVPWRRLRDLRYRYRSSWVEMTRSRSVRTILRFATEELPAIQRRLETPELPKHWRNEPAGTLGVAQILGPRRKQIRALARRHAVRRLRVYGSVARGEADDRSDVDLLVDWKSKSAASRQYALKARLEEAIGRSVDLYDSDHLYWATRERVLSEAIDFL